MSCLSYMSFMVTWVTSVTPFTVIGPRAAPHVTLISTAMFYHHLRNELWKLFGKKRTYIGFGAFLLAQNAMLLTFHYTHWQTQMETMLAGNGYLAQKYVSALTVAVLM